MRAKRALVVGSLVVSLLAGGSFGGLAYLDASSSEDAGSVSFGRETLAPAPTLGRDVGTAADERVEETSFTSVFLWFGALVSGIVFVVSVLLFRVEVRKEKDNLRVKKSRADYYRELRKYNAQLKGPPRHNT